MPAGVTLPGMAPGAASNRPLDAVVVGSGPNGLAAAITLARAGLAVEVYEGAQSAGGGCRTEDLTLPGFHHDVCAAVHPLAAASPFFARLDLRARGVEFRSSPVAFAHPLDGGRAAAVFSPVFSPETTERGAAAATRATAESLGRDAGAYRSLFGSLARDLGQVLPTLLAPLRTFPGHPLALARLALPGLLPASGLARCFRTEEARGLLAGAAAHSVLPLTSPLTGAFGLLFVALGHALGWPVAEGGSGRLAGALVEELRALGGEVRTRRTVGSLDELPRARAVLLDVSPHQLAAWAEGRASPAYTRALRRFGYGPGVCKVDWALAGPVPWEAGACREAATVHVGGTFEEVAASEAEVAAGRHPGRPFCLVAQPGVVDGSRAPAGHSTLWAYCHVPAGSTVDMADRIEAQVERFAPGFRDLVIGRAVRTAAALAAGNPNYVGGDISGGAATLRQMFLRPTARWSPYRTALPGVYLCSSSTPPGAGVHGMCGYWAARAALSDLGVEPPGSSRRP